MRRAAMRRTTGAVLAAALTSGAAAQVTFTLDWESRTVGLADGAFGQAITEGDLLTSTYVAGSTPSIVISGGVTPAVGLSLPLHPAAIGHAAGVPAGVEVDAISFGRDLPAGTGGVMQARPVYLFSVDEWAHGFFPIPPLVPNVISEGSIGNQEAAADVFTNYPPANIGPGAPPLAPLAIAYGNTAVLDGNGLPAGGAPSLQLVEPQPPTMFASPIGDNVDGFDLSGTFGAVPTFPIFYSLDDNTVDVYEGFVNSGSALANYGISGADVIIVPSPGMAFLYAPANFLGLDLFGPGTDDLDALAIRENGDNMLQLPTGPYSWDNGVTDMVLFSVRRGSAIIGVNDSQFGVPIEPGDILMPGPLGSPPRIWIAAENLGLSTVRSLGPGPFGGADDLDALDVENDCDGDGVPDTVALEQGLVQDCNGNLFPDDCDIALGLVSDCDGDGVPDTCQGDCNGNGVPDPCDIANGDSADCNADGIPDECQGLCTADTNGDCAVDVTDLVNVVLDWGCVGACTGDVTGDMVVDVSDLVQVVLEWGPC